MQTQISVYIRVDQAQKLNKEKNKSEVIRKALDLYYQNPKEVIIVTREEMIGGMKGEIIKVNGDWLAENDEEMLDWLIGSDYWGRGFEDVEIKPEDAVLEMHFESRGAAYKATFKDHPEGIEQSLSNQPMWGDDSWEDWKTEDIKKYWEMIK